MTQMATSYQPMQSLESKKLLHDLLLTPRNYEKHFERYSSGLIFRIGYGKTVETGDEEHVRRILEVVHHVERVASPGAYMVDTFPLLKYLPSFWHRLRRRQRYCIRRKLVYSGISPTSFFV